MPRGSAEGAARARAARPAGQKRGPKGLMPEVARPPPEKRNPKRDRALILLLSGAGYSEVARRVGVSVNAVFEWSKQKDFVETLADARDAAIEASVVRLSLLRSEAVDVVLKVMRDPKAGASQRLRAACEVLDRSLPTARIEVGAELRGLTTEELRAKLIARVASDPKALEVVAELARPATPTPAPSIEGHPIAQEPTP